MGRDRPKTQSAQTIQAHIQMQNCINVSVMFLKYAPATNSIQYFICFMYVATTQHLNYCGHKSTKTISSFVVIKPGMNWKAASKFIHNFQLKLLDTAVTLKNVTITESGIQEQVKLNK